jgi:DNA polymerase-1
MILQVHDELVFDVRKKELDDLAGIVRSGMEGILKLSVPLSVNIETGPNWLDMETYDT